MEFLGIALGTTLLVLLGAQVTLVVGLARRQSWGRAALALVVAPLAPWWGWRTGLRVPCIVWGAALAMFTLGVCAAGVASTATGW